MRCTMYWWRITLSNALLWRFWEDPAVSSLGETRIRAETFLSGRNAIYALKKGAFQPGLLATYYTFNQGGILEIQKFRCVSSTKVFESLDFYQDLVVSCSVLRLFLSRSHLPHSGWVSDGCHGELRGRIGLSLTYRFAAVLSHSLH